MGKDFSRISFLPVTFFAGQSVGEGHGESARCEKGKRRTKNENYKGEKNVFYKGIA